jgi:hypothetical protein
VAAVGDDGELHAVRAAVVEQRLDRRPDRPAGVEDVVDEDARAALERKVEARRADERLRVQRRLAPADGDVVAVKGDVDGAVGDLDTAELLDQAAQPLRERDAAGVDADQRDPVEVRVALDDLVRDPGEGPRKSLGVQEDSARGDSVRIHSTPFRPLGTGLKDGAAHRLTGPADVSGDDGALASRRWTTPTSGCAT